MIMMMKGLNNIFCSYRIYCVRCYVYTVVWHRSEPAALKVTLNDLLAHYGAFLYEFKWT